MSNQESIERWKQGLVGEESWWGNLTESEINKFQQIIKTDTDLILEHLNVSSASQILDIGCGPCGMIEFIGEGHRYGIDPLMEYYLGNFNLNMDINYQTGTGEDIPFEDSFFDVVIATNALDHTRQPQRTLQEVRRVLKRNGFFVTSLYTYGFFLKLWRDYRERANKPEEDEHAYSFTTGQFERFLKKKGFQPVLKKVNSRFEMGKKLGIWHHWQHPESMSKYERTFFKLDKLLNKELFSENPFTSYVLLVCRASDL